jgi:polysaccharide biosynthesis/export protein
MKKPTCILSITATLVFVLASHWTRSPSNRPPLRKIIASATVMSSKSSPGRNPIFPETEILVRLDGKISFPLLDDIQATGRTPAELKNAIQSGLKAYVADPHVTVTIRNAGSQRFYILGEVARTGEYPLVKDLTVLQAFALAGGFTEWASKKEIILFRKDGDKENVIQVNYRDIIRDKSFKQNVIIQANDTIIVP